MTDIKIGIFGVAGRMGRMVLKAVLETPGTKIAAGSVSPQSSAKNIDLGELAGARAQGIVATDRAQDVIAASDIVIDFTPQTSFQNHARLMESAGKAWVCGTTGLGGEDFEILQKLSLSCPVVWSANMSLGVILLAALVEEAAAKLPATFDIEMVEMHHRAKRDAPSGTALLLAEAAASGRNTTLSNVLEPARTGITQSRKPGGIAIAALRGGDVVGEHNVIFAGDGERLELTHKASDRTIFAQGAVRAALWLYGREAGLYTMRDVLGINNKAAGPG